jgi:formylglycine-generating enzyme required for sulfatase activity
MHPERQPEGTTRSSDGDRKDMVWIPDGTFRMGSGEFYIEERPVHKVAAS